MPAPPPPPRPVRRPVPPPPGHAGRSSRSPLTGLTAKIAAGLLPDPEARLVDPEFRSVYDRLLRDDLALYSSEVVRGPKAPPYNGRTLLGPQHVAWAEAARTSPRINALAARDHGKSHEWTVCYSCWQIDRVRPGQLGYIFSATREQAVEQLQKVVQEVCGGGEYAEGNPKLRHLLPLRKQSDTRVVFANGSEIRARGFNTRTRGGHPAWLVCDDILDDDHIWSETVRQKGIDKFLSSIEPMVIPGGQLVVVGTPFHAQDLYAYLERSGEYTVLKHPALQPDGRPLWPARYGSEALAAKKRLVGSIRWAREYMCRPITDDASLFPSWLFEQAGAKQPYPLGLPLEHWRNLGATCYLGVDLAMSASASADWLVAFVLAVTPDGHRHVVDIVRRQGLGYQAQVDLIVNVGERYDVALAFVESNQYQRVISDMVVRSSGVPVRAFYTTGKVGSKQASTVRRGMNQSYSASKNALDQGVPGLRILFENGKVSIPWAAGTRERVATWLGELTSFGWADGKLQGVGAHDDTVMAFWMADRAASTGEGISLDFATKAQGGRARPGDPTPEEDEPDFFGMRAGPSLPGVSW